MKKLLSIAFIACAILNPLGTSAQTKSKQKNDKKVVSVASPAITSSVDSVSYALGVGMVRNGLVGYLNQMGILVDTVAINADYTNRIEQESDASKKASLQAQFKNKIDSAVTVNAKSIEDFIQGFNQTMKANADNKAFNFGIAIAGQITPMIENFSKEVLRNNDVVNKDAFISGFVTILKNETPLFENTDEMVQNLVAKSQQEKELRQAEELKAQYAQDIAAGDKFMEVNKGEAGVVTLPSGLQYKVLTQGTGAKPTIDDQVTVHYKGTLIDGSVFDSSYDRGEPATFGVGQVIKGWTEALQLMPVGSKWVLYIPYYLAYGEREQGIIKPFSNLIFEVELLNIEGDNEN